MKFIPTGLESSYVVELDPFQDNRGWFARTFCEQEFAQVGHKDPWVQINHSFTVQSGTIRGLHYQLPPFSEIKLVRCIAGAVFDVIVDLRAHSATFLKHFAVELSASNRKMLYIPTGFAHGFQSLQDDTELIYHHSALYTPNTEGGLNYLDPRIEIEWPLSASILSDRDQSHKFLDDTFQGIELI